MGTGSGTTGTSRGTTTVLTVPLYIRMKAKLKQDRYVAKVPGEVGWFGFIKQYETEPGERPFLVVEDVFVYPQSASTGGVDGKMDKMHELFEARPELMENMEQMKFFGHSHGSMDAYHSGVDMEMIDDWEKSGIDWCVSLVQNKEGKVDARLEQFLPFRAWSKVSLIPMVNQELETEIDEELKQFLDFSTSTTKSSDKKSTGTTTTRRVTGSTHTNTDSKHEKGGTTDRPMIVVEGGYRKTYVDGELVGMRKLGVPSTEQETPAEAAAQELDETEPDPSRSIARSIEKVVEGATPGKAPAPPEKEEGQAPQLPYGPYPIVPRAESTSQGVKLPTQTASEARRSSPSNPPRNAAKPLSELNVEVEKPKLSSADRLKEALTTARMQRQERVRRETDEAIVRGRGDTPRAGDSLRNSEYYDEADAARELAEISDDDLPTTDRLRNEDFDPDSKRVIEADPYDEEIAQQWAGMFPGVVAW